MERLCKLFHHFKTARELDEFGKPDKLKYAFQKRPVKHGAIDSEYIDYCREDVWATAALTEQLMAEAVLHPIDPERIYSPASVAKAYRRELGITPMRERQPDFPKEVEGFGAVGFYGGRTEVRIRRAHMPIMYADFMSMYLLVCALLNVVDFDRCERVQVVEEDPERVQAWLEGLSPDDFRNPETWRELCALVLIEPAGDILPVRAEYTARIDNIDGPKTNSNYGIGLNPLVSSPEPCGIRYRTPPSPPSWRTALPPASSSACCGSCPRGKQRHCGRGCCAARSRSIHVSKTCSASSSKSDSDRSDLPRPNPSG